MRNAERGLRNETAVLIPQFAIRVPRFLPRLDYCGV